MTTTPEPEWPDVVGSGPRTATNWRASMSREDLETENASLRTALSAWQVYSHQLEDKIAELEQNLATKRGIIAAYDRLTDNRLKTP